MIFTLVHLATRSWFTAGLAQTPAAGIDPFLKDIFQILIWSLSGLGIIVTAMKALHEMRDSRTLRQRELRWNKAKLAREIVQKASANPRIAAAKTMLDWDGRLFQVEEGDKKAITWNQVRLALRVEEMQFTKLEAFVRDCFDQFFDSVEEVEHYIHTGLIDFADVEFHYAYYFRKIETQFKLEVGRFLAAFNYGRVISFARRFDPAIDLRVTSGPAGA